MTEKIEIENQLATLAIDKAAEKAAADLKAAEEKAEKEKEELIKTQRLALLPDDIDLLFKDPREKSQAVEDLLTIADQYFNQEILEMKKSIEAIKLEKVKADKEKILGESRYAIIEGLGLASYCTASKQIVIEKAGAMDEELWGKSLEKLKKTKADKEEEIRVQQEQENKQNQELQADLVKQGYQEGDKLIRDAQGGIEIWRYVGRVMPLWEPEDFKRKVK